MIPELAKHTEKLNYFYVMATSGSLQASARKLGLSAPTLSYNLKHLEEITGTQLMIRSNKGVRLTERGELLLVFCRKLFKELDQVERLMTNPKMESVTRIKVGTYPSIAVYFWPHVLAAIGTDSSLSVSIMTNRSQVVQEALYRRDIDLALTVETNPMQGVIHHELYKDDYAFYASSTWKGSQISRDQMRDSTIMYIPDAKDREGRSLRQYLLGWDLPFKEEFELDSLEVVSEFIKRGYGLGILPTQVANSLGDSVKLVRPEGTGTSQFGEHRFYLYYREDLELPQRLMDIFLDASMAAVTQIGAAKQ